MPNHDWKLLSVHVRCLLRTRLPYDILQRMQGHRAKQRSMLRKLELAALFRPGLKPPVS
jgi:hypothetical protein